MTYLVRETIDHGDYHHVREIELPSLSDMALVHLLRSSPYCYLHGDAPPDLAARLAKLRADLDAGSDGSWGWSWFRVVPHAAA